MPLADATPLVLPRVGYHQLRILSPYWLELTLVNTRPAAAGAPTWDFVGSNGKPKLPPASRFQVRAGSKQLEVAEVGFKRRAIYAPLKERDLRVGNWIYLHLGSPIPEGHGVEVRSPGGDLWPSQWVWRATNAPLRWSPVIHVNQTGYAAHGPKLAVVGYFLGDAGELDLGRERVASGGGRPDDGPSFALVDAQSGAVVFQGQLRARPDRGFPYASYQKVYEADFSIFTKVGEYRLQVPGLGASYPFLIDDAVIGAFARTYALGLYHQRCGAANELPYTRFVHQACHLAPAEVPSVSTKFEAANYSLEKETENSKENPRHTAPRLRNVDASLYPFVRRGKVSVRGGHHDAGDYSKYTINSAGLVHHLVFAADVFPGAGGLDNLGLPESGDGIGDLFQVAKWEADFLAKMQDEDGGFYFLVYPRGREYENDVLPDKGDPQVVFPKTTSATAAAGAALAQCSASPGFRRAYPEAAAAYLAHAEKAWAFLQRAFERYGKDGAYQKITHYGDQFMHDDELAWLACELYLATGKPEYHEKTLAWLNPADPETRKWGWLRLFDSYGNAIRSYAFGVQTGRIKANQISPALQAACRQELAAAGGEQWQRAVDSAYGTSFPAETKRARSAGWYFSGDAAFDLAVACQLDERERPRPAEQLISAIWSNLGYEQGCNPVNVSFLTGLGWHWQREIVHQYAQNDRRVLPPSGIPLGNVQAGYGWLDPYKEELGKLTYPSDGAEDEPYPIYDRWGDSFNLSQEFVILNQGKALGYLAWLMSQSSLRDQRWKPVPASIAVQPAQAGPGTARELRLEVQNLDLGNARIWWEGEGQEPFFARQWLLKAGNARPRWIEAEAVLPDGRRLQAAKELP